MNKEQSRHLYFIRLLQQALESDTPAIALQDAINEIRSKAARAEFKIGYGNFLSFVQVMENELLSDPELKNSIEDWFNIEKGIDILIGNFVGSDSEKQRVMDYFKDDVDFQELRHEIRNYGEKQGSLLVEIIKDDLVIGAYDLGKSGNIITLRGITPGDYMIRLSNGRLLWHSKLDKNNLQWSLAFPKRDYPAAAMTEPLRAEPSISETICDGNLRLDVIPGLETGTIVISQISKGK